MEKVGQYCYLGSMITNDGKCHVEIKRITCRNKEDNSDGKRCLLQKKGINEWKTKYKFEEGNNHVYDMECGFIQIDNLNLAKGKYQKMREKTHLEE